MALRPPTTPGLFANLGQTMLFQGKPETATFVSGKSHTARSPPFANHIQRYIPALGRAKFFLAASRKVSFWLRTARGAGSQWLGTFISTSREPSASGWMSRRQRAKSPSGETQSRHAIRFRHGTPSRLDNKGSAIRIIRHCKRRPSLPACGAPVSPRNESHWANRDDPNAYFVAPSFVAVKDALEPIPVQ